MATHSSITENDLKYLSSLLKRDLHVKEVRMLATKHQMLSKITHQNKRISELKGQLTELESALPRSHSAQYRLQDNQLKGYLIYLLQMEEFFGREVKTKMAIIQKMNQQINKLVVKLCQMRNKYAKKLKNVPTQSSELILLDKMSNRMNQIQKRVSVVQNQNKELRTKILDTVTFLRQYKKFEIDYLSKMKHMTSAVQKHLENAVALYDEREDFVNKTILHQDDISQDVRETHYKEDLLKLVNERNKKFKDFEKLQNKKKADSRIPAAGRLIAKGTLGLMPTSQKEEKEKSRDSDKRTPSEMRHTAGIGDDKISSMCNRMEDLLREITRTQSRVSELKKENRNLLMAMSPAKRKLKWEISEKQAEAGLSNTEVEKANLARNSERNELNKLLENLWILYKLCGLDESEFKDGVDDSNAERIREEIEKKIIEYLMLNEYLKMKEDEMKSQISNRDSHTSIIEDQPETGFLSTLLARTTSETQTRSGEYLQQTKSILSSEGPKQTEIATVTEFESTENSKEDDESK